MGRSEDLNVAMGSVAAVTSDMAPGEEQLPKSVCNIGYAVDTDADGVSTPIDEDHLTPAIATDLKCGTNEQDFAIPFSVEGNLTRDGRISEEKTNLTNREHVSGNFLGLTEGSRGKTLTGKNVTDWETYAKKLEEKQTERAAALKGPEMMGMIKGRTQQNNPGKFQSRPREHLKRLSTSVEKVDLDFTLGPLASLPHPTKRQRLEEQRTPPSSGSVGSKKKKPCLEKTSIPSAAAALKSSFWNSATVVSDANVAASSFYVAHDDGGSSPLSPEGGRREKRENGEKVKGSNVEHHKRVSDNEQRSINEAENVMTVATMAAQGMSESGLTPEAVSDEIRAASSTNYDVCTPSDKPPSGMTKPSAKILLVDFDPHAAVQEGGSEEDDAVSIVSSASSLVESYEGDVYCRPVPPAPPSTPATATDMFQPLPYHSDVAVGELAYQVVGKAKCLDSAENFGKPLGSTTVPAAVLSRYLPPPPFCGDEAMTPLPDVRVPVLTSTTTYTYHHSQITSGLQPSEIDDLSGAFTEPRGGCTVEEEHETSASIAARKRQRAQEQEMERQRPQPRPLRSRTSEFESWEVGGRYQLKRVLGRGSYGEVAQAVDLYAVAARHEGEDHLQAQQQSVQQRTSNKMDYVAVKKISKAFEQEVDAVRLFREMHILRRLRGHECIIQLVDVVQPSSSDLKYFNDLYLVFEYVDTDLYKLIMSPQYLTTEHVQTFLYQMLVGLKFIHSSSVIHRDLKPANILLNEDCTLKICDFGLARIVNSETISPSSTNSTNDDFIANSSNTISRPTRLSASVSPRAGAENEVGNPFKATSQPGLSRQLTKHVVTRWYRAPELILIQPYAAAVDIWSLGCIFAELLSMQEGSVPTYQDRVPLFPGGSCYPLSGESGSTNSDELLDQLSVIFSVIGMPSEDDLKSVGKANEYIKTLKRKQGRSLTSLYPAASPAAIDLLKTMLMFNPFKRCTAEEAIEHDFLKHVRRKDMEKRADQPLVSPEFLETNRINLRTLKEKTYQEVLWYKQSSSRFENRSIGN